MTLSYLTVFNIAASLRAKEGIEMARCCATQLADAALVCGDAVGAADWKRVLDALDGLEHPDGPEHRE